MNKILVSILVALYFQACVSAHEKVLLDEPTIDKRVELLSIVFRLAGSPEYSLNEFKPYVNRIDQYFDKYKTHELIQFTKSIISEYEIAYDGPMWLATHLDDNLKLLADVKDVWQQDPRWTKESVEKYVPLLQEFYKDTKFDIFFKDNTDLYNEAIKRFASIGEQIDLNWGYSFFGKEPAELFFYKIGLGISGNCFGTNVDFTDGSRKVYAIMGVWTVDNTGFPVFSVIPNLPVLIHEYSHPFVDKLTEKNKAAFRDSGEKIFSVVNSEAYTSWEVILDEALINAAVAKYMKDHAFGQSEIESWIRWIKTGFGFFWIENLVDELEKYDKQRDQYPTLESFMPRLAEAYSIWTENI
jgi:hypothetical protein